MTDIFLQTTIYLSVAVLIVPLAKRAGLGSVLGFLISGLLIGPFLGLVGEETGAIQHFAEFGVVMMLFVVGLELEPGLLWGMRHRLFGLGGLQVGVTTIIVMGGALLMEQPWQYSVTIGLIFSLSSTAIVLQTLNEKRLNIQEGGRSAFSVLLFQDIAVIPMLAIIPLLVIPEVIKSTITPENSAAHESMSLVSGLSGWQHGAVIVGVIAAVIIIGHYLCPYLFRYVGNAKQREIFTATALLLVVGIAALMSLVGLSPALGTFLAGVVLANSEFKHEIESNIGPFKGLLLGLFFITVGAGINVELLVSQWSFILSLSVLVIIAKVVTLLGLARVFNIRGSNGWLFALSLGQVGEFGFVLLCYSEQSHVLPSSIAEPLLLVVSLTMFLTPLLFIVYDKVILPKYQAQSNLKESDNIDEAGEVIIAGMGRFGQIVNRMLRANGIKTVAIDYQTTQIDAMRMINMKSYFGDATSPHLLRTAGIEQASALVIAIDEKESATELVGHVKSMYPDIKIIARAFDRSHYYELKERGADVMVSETLYSAIEVGSLSLKAMGINPATVDTLKQSYIDIESDYSEKLYTVWKEASGDKHLSSNYRELLINIEKTLAEAVAHQRQ